MVPPKMTFFDGALCRRISFKYIVQDCCTLSTQFAKKTLKAQITSLHFFDAILRRLHFIDTFHRHLYFIDAFLRGVHFVYVFLLIFLILTDFAKVKIEITATKINTKVQLWLDIHNPRVEKLKVIYRRNKLKVIYRKNT